MAYINEYGEIIRNNEFTEIIKEIKDNCKEQMDLDFAKKLISDMSENEFSIELVKYIVEQIEQYDRCITENFAKYLIGKLKEFIPEKENSAHSFVPPANVDEKKAIESAKKAEKVGKEEKSLPSNIE